MAPYRLYEKTTSSAVNGVPSWKLVSRSLKVHTRPSSEGVALSARLSENVPSRLRSYIESYTSSKIVYASESTATPGLSVSGLPAHPMRTTTGSAETGGSVPGGCVAGGCVAGGSVPGPHAVSAIAKSINRVRNFFMGFSSLQVDWTIDQLYSRYSQMR